MVQWLARWVLWPLSFISTLESEDRRELIEAVYRIVAQVEKRLDAIRIVDKEAVRVTASDLERRLVRFEREHAEEQKRQDDDRRQLAVDLELVTAKLTDQFALAHEETLTQATYDVQHAALMERVSAIERWQYKLVGGLVFATFVAPLVTGMVVYFITRGV